MPRGNHGEGDSLQVVTITRERLASLLDTEQYAAAVLASLHALREAAAAVVTGLQRNEGEWVECRFCYGVLKAPVRPVHNEGHAKSCPIPALVAALLQEADK